jgi:FkbM family methyltransferase
MNVVKRCRYGLMIFNRNDIWQGRSFETYGEYSESEVEVFRKAVKAGDVVVEIGANMGSHTLPLSRLVGPNGSVLAAEPERHCFYTLCGNLAVNNLRNVVALQQAFGAETGVVNVPELAQDGVLNVGATELEKDWSNVAHYPVAVNTIDSLNLSRLDFLKIDVEGMEEKVLRGGEATIKKLQPVLYVENDRADKEESLKNYLLGLGYDIYVHYAPFWNPQNFFELSDNVFADTVSLNLLCLPKSRDTGINPGDFGMQKNHGGRNQTDAPVAVSQSLSELDLSDEAEISIPPR